MMQQQRPCSVCGRDFMSRSRTHHLCGDPTCIRMNSQRYNRRWEKANNEKRLANDRAHNAANRDRRNAQALARCHAKPPIERARRHRHFESRSDQWLAKKVASIWRVNIAEARMMIANNSFPE